MDLSEETKLSNILNKIGYYFYKCRGIYFTFEIKKKIYMQSMKKMKKDVF